MQSTMQSLSAPKISNRYEFQPSVRREVSPKPSTESLQSLQLKNLLQAYSPKGTCD